MLRITETSFLRLKSSSRLDSSTFGNYSLKYIKKLLLGFESQLYTLECYQ